MGFPKKRKSAAVIDDSDDGEVEGTSKRSKASGAVPFASTATAQTDAEGNPYWEISKARRVTVSEFRGVTMVNVREYYQKEGEWKPGAKGISMTAEQYSTLVTLLPRIEEALTQRGVTVPRPEYDAPPAEGGAKPNPTETKMRSVSDIDDEDKKANFEATSDEED